jgi:transposase
MALCIGIDLGRKSAHDVVILKRETALKMGKPFRFHTSPDGFELFFKKIEAVRVDHEPLMAVIDSPGKAWIPVAAVLEHHGVTVYRPSAERMYHLRRAGHGKNKTNRIDAITLDRCLITFPQDTHEVFLAKGQEAKLNQLVRQRDRIVDSQRRRKQRIQELCEVINPELTKAMGAFMFTEAGHAFLQKYLDPKLVVRIGEKKLTRFLADRHPTALLPHLVEQIMIACQNAKTLYDDLIQIPFDAESLQEEMTWELDCLALEHKRIKALEKQIAKIYNTLDPHKSLISLPGIADILAASIWTSVGDIERFPSIKKHRGFLGFYSTKHNTGDDTNGGRKISKQGANRYKRALYLAADNAYKWDVELCAFYHNRRQSGHNHTQAVCAVANAKLLPRIHLMLNRIKQVQKNGNNPPQYVFRDLSGNPISKVEARALIVAKWGEVEYTK